jgi:hypothetical protein
MCSQDANPYRAPQEMSDGATREPSQLPAGLCRRAQDVLWCLGTLFCMIGLMVVGGGFLDSCLPDWFFPVYFMILLAITLLDALCAMVAICHRGLANRLIGMLGLLWIVIVVLSFVFAASNDGAG